MKEFGREGGAGEKLQQALLEKTKNSDSWVGGREYRGEKGIMGGEIIEGGRRGKTIGGD